MEAPRVLREVNGKLVSSRLLTYEDAAAYLSIAESTIEQYVRERRLRAIWAGPSGEKSARVDVRDLDRLVDAMPELHAAERSAPTIRAAVAHRGGDKVASIGDRRR